MSKKKPPVPLPRRNIYTVVRTEDDEPLKPASSPQCPPESSQNNKTQPPPLPVKPPSLVYHSKPPTQEDDAPSHDYKDMTAWDSVCRDLQLRAAPEAEVIRTKAEHLYKAVQVYIQLICDCGGTMKQHIDELHCIADNLDKVSKGTKVAGITGGATTVAGGVAAAAGIILSPFTLGASLALTAVGVGVAAAGGVTGASAAIANKVNLTQDKKKLDRTLQEYQRLSEEVQTCLKFINDGMEQLKQHGLSALSQTRTDSGRTVKLLELASTGGGSALALEANSKASGLIRGFGLGMDFYFTKGKDGHKVKKGLESKLAKKIRSLAEDLETGLQELIKIKDVFEEHC